MSSLVKNEFPIAGDIPGAGVALEQGLTLGKIRDWLKLLPTLQFSIFKVNLEEEYSNSKDFQKFLQKFWNGMGESVLVTEIC